MSAIPEPPDGVIVCWFDVHGDPVLVTYRADQHDEEPNEADHWYQANGDEIFTWAELLDEGDGFHGPVELASRGEIGPGHVFAGDDE